MATDGTFLSICPEWQSNLDLLADVVVRQDRFPLAGAAQEGTLDVAHNRVLRSTGWLYVEDPPAILSTEDVPVAGDIVNVSYRPE